MSAPSSPPANAHLTAIQMRFGDTDALGHANNASFAQYAEAARLDLLQAMGEEVRSLILAHLAIDFRRQVRFGAELRVASWVERVGTTSVTLLQAVLADGEVAADVRSVVVFFDYATQRPEPLPASARSRLERHAVAPEPVGRTLAD
jgi:acyl-CoA thioester hydrolase